MEVDLIIKEMLKKAGFNNQKALSAWAGVSEGYITKWKKQGYLPEDIIEKFESEFGKLINSKSKSIDSNFIILNFFPNVYAAAGGGAINGDSNAVPMTFDKGFLESLGLKQFKNLDMIKVTGDSMEPFIQNGEFVILERKDEAQNNDIVVANINGQIYIKRYEADPFFKWIKLKSENEFSGDILLENETELNALSIIGIVRAKIRPF